MERKKEIRNGLQTIWRERKSKFDYRQIREKEWNGNQIRDNLDQKKEIEVWLQTIWTDRSKSNYGQIGKKEKKIELDYRQKKRKKSELKTDK